MFLYIYLTFVSFTSQKSECCQAFGYSACSLGNFVGQPFFSLIMLKLCSLPKLSTKFAAAANDNKGTAVARISHWVSLFWPTYYLSVPLYYAVKVLWILR